MWKLQNASDLGSNLISGESAEFHLFTALHIHDEIMFDVPKYFVLMELNSITWNWCMHLNEVNSMSFISLWVSRVKTGGLPH